MRSNAGCSMRRLAALAIAMISLTGCATVASEPRVAAVCAPGVQYRRDLPARAAEELVQLPHGSVIGEMLSDYEVMRQQARACSRR